MTEATTRRPLAEVTGASSGIGCEQAVQFTWAGFDLDMAAGGEGILVARVQARMTRPEDGGRR